MCDFYLKQAGFEPRSDVVCSAEEFVNALRSGSYDIILADYRMPNWSGMDALETLKREGKDIPFILVTGTVGEEVAVECIKKGATDYIIKDRLRRLPLAVQRALDEKAARDQHKEEERDLNLLALIVESSDDAIIGMSPDWTILSWNRGASIIYGYQAEEIEGKPIEALFAPESAGEWREVTDALQRGEPIVRHDMKGVTQKGSAIEVALTISALRNADGQIGWAATIRDITEQKRLLREFLVAQKMEAVGRLAAGVAHDFNNLLTVVTGYSSLALEHLNAPDRLQTEISEINKAGNRAASLTRQLLAFSKKQVLQPQVLDLNHIVADMDRMLRRVIGEDIELVTVLDPNLSPVKADPGQIEQVIMNLAVNARDAMPKGGHLTIETGTVNLAETLARPHINVQPGAYVKLAVTDTGTGMNAETQAHIFEPFFTTKGQGGTGLGLSTVFGIVEQSGGTILVYSEPGHGTTFKIYLPMVHEPAVRTERASATSASRGSETILVVEDEEAVRALICMILGQQGYRALQAESGPEALEICGRDPQQIDLMITDLVMPSMGGGELAGRIAALRPMVKVLFMSGYTDTAIVQNGVLDPDTAFLEKPFTPAALSRKVRETLDA